MEWLIFLMNFYGRQKHYFKVAFRELM